jgi:hypothetical protein
MNTWKEASISNKAWKTRLPADHGGGNYMAQAQTTGGTLYDKIFEGAWNGSTTGNTINHNFTSSDVVP